MKVQYLLSYLQIESIRLLSHIDGLVLSGEVNDRQLIEYDISTDKIIMLDALLGQKGVIVKEEKPWPSKGDKYYYINDGGAILFSQWTTMDDIPSWVDIGRRDIGNIFKTEEEARFELERLKVLNELKSLSDDDQEWDNKHRHYTIIYVAYSDKFEVWVNLTVKLPHEYGFKSEESAKAAIKAIGEDRLKKYVFNIKEK